MKHWENLQECIEMTLCGAAILAIVEGTIEVLCFDQLIGSKSGYPEGQNSHEGMRAVKDAPAQIEEENRKKLLFACNEARALKDFCTITVSHDCDDGRKLLLNVRIRWIESQGERSLFYAFVKDVTPQKVATIGRRKQKEEQHQSELFRMLMEASDVIIYDYDVRNDEMFYYIPLEDGTRKSWEIQEFSQMIQQSSLIHPDNRRLYLEYLMQKDCYSKKIELDHRANYYEKGYRWYRTSFCALKDENDAVRRVIGQVVDITETRNLRRRAERDGMTRLLNRQTFEHKINQLIMQKKLQGVFYLLDVDNFKQVNDTCGHTVGDGLLMCIAKILEMKFRSEDLKSRLGGDEFAVLTTCSMEASMIDARAAELLEAVRMLRVDLQIEFPISVSIGIACAEEDACSFEQLYERADVALYQAKHGGKNRYCNRNRNGS